jgi:hypothetical protein
MLLILRPTAMPRTARSAALLDMGASTDGDAAYRALGGVVGHGRFNRQRPSIAGWRS